jgi:hypothetical protein
MLRKCRNCGELKVGCNPHDKPVCELWLPMIWQLIQPDKINGFQRCFRSLGMKIEPIGKNDFTIEMCDSLTKKSAGAKERWAKI